MKLKRSRGGLSSSGAVVSIVDTIFTFSQNISLTGPITGPGCCSVYSRLDRGAHRAPRSSRTSELSSCANYRTQNVVSLA